MLPEAAASYALGLIPSAAVTGLQLYVHRRKVSSARYRLLQENLRKVNLYWREAHGEVTDFQKGREPRDLANYEKNLFLMGAGFMALSWLGFIFNLIVFFSIHSWAVSRKEREIFESDLVKKDLPVADIRKVLVGLK